MEHLHRMANEHGFIQLVLMDKVLNILRHCRICVGFVVRRIPMVSEVLRNMSIRFPKALAAAALGEPQTRENIGLLNSFASTLSTGRN